MRGGRPFMMTAVAVLAAAPWAFGADRARAREGGSSDRQGGSSDRQGGDRAGAAAGRRSGAGSSRSGSARATSDRTREAQLRHPRAGTGTADRRFRGRIHRHVPYFGRFGYYGSFGYGYPYGYSFGYPWYGYGFAPYSYGAYRYDGARSGSLRVMVEPEETKVYVDGYYAGVVDDFDGIFQRLRVAPGRHEVSLKLDGYRTQHFRVYVPYDHTIKIRHDMVSGTGEDRDEFAGAGPVEGGYDDVARYDDGERAPAPGPAPAGERGTLRLDVVPGDASVYVDGEFRGVARDVRRLPLEPGRHEVEVVRPGYRTESRMVEIRSAEETDLDVDLVAGR